LIAESFVKRLGFGWSLVCLACANANEGREVSLTEEGAPAKGHIKKKGIPKFLENKLSNSQESDPTRTFLIGAEKWWMEEGATMLMIF
jgi:hypothetical protein